MKSNIQHSNRPDLLVQDKKNGGRKYELNTITLAA
jgi:hypothetical protein